uniref:NADH dehydrogenase subunit 4 n=1 Tax=Chlorophila portschinski TaxID=2969964 RepID=UPI002176BD2A|nr:NADH dehydrogenase subunit 4 [Chlorophila portschinski]UUL71660.1 NADH dehydrogenase subunit 4 [Chlorophila portschinski]
MMKFILSLVFMIPLSFIGGFWYNQFMWFVLSFLFIISFGFGSVFSGLFMDMGLDVLSFLMILLSFWICSLMILSSSMIYLKSNWSGLFLFVVLILMISLFVTFGSMNMFIFYVFFEISLVPTFMLILGWGYQPERLQAGIYLLFYTLFASLPMMVSLFYCYESFSSLNWFFFNQVDSLLVYLLINFVFFIKVPMYFVHLWLPKAHVEAPVAGSMILAGIMLKLGGYGLLRFLSMFILLGLKINWVFISLSMVGGLYISLVCLRQSDMKSLIAYSSVAHMGLVLSGILTMSYWGFVGALVMMIAHGLCSSGLFCLANISYERLLSRSLYLNKGMLNVMPNLAMFWFLLVSSSMAAPPSFNLLGEIVLINSVMAYSILNMGFLMLISFFSAVYSLYLYSFSQHGSVYSGVFCYYSCYVREYLVLSLHWLPLNLLIFGGDVFSIWV